MSNVDSQRRPIRSDYCAIAVQQRVLQHIRGKGGHLGARPAAHQTDDALPAGFHAATIRAGLLIRHLPFSRMPHRKREAEADASAAYHAAVSAEEKLARLLGLWLVKDMKSKSDQVTLLRRAGFEVSEVASLLDMTENNVMVTDHLGRKKTVD